MVMALSNIREQVHAALRSLAEQCDGAASRDGHGFTAFDANNGKRLAAQDDLSPSDVLYAAKMLQKYHNQIIVPDLRAAKRYFAINGPRREGKDDSIIDAVTFEEEDNESMDEQMEVEQEPESAPTDIVLSGEQKALLDVMEGTRQHLFITGRAGAGKSVLLRAFREQTKKRIVVAAPTGIAALNVQGQTLHSLFKLPPQLHRKGGLSPNSRVCSLLKRIDTLVIDEISMVRADLLDAVDERLREAHGNDIPFGGVQVIMFGDVYQLPPVVEDGLRDYFEAVHQGHFFFNALVWKEAEFKVYELTQVFRQKDPVFKDILNAVRDGSATDEQIAQLNARYGIAIPAEGTVTLAPTNNLVTQINQQRLDRLPGKAHQYQAEITGQMKRSVFPTEENLQLKKDAQIVMLKNDQDGRWVNGTVGMIADLADDAVDVRINGIVYRLERETWEEIVYEYDHDTQKVESHVASSFTQFPIRLAWALTIHKSQGQTYESVALDLTTATFAAGQLYVALSRATSLEGLYLKMPVKRRDIIVEPKVTAFMARRETIKVEIVEETQAEIDQYLAEETVAIVEEAQEVAEELYEEGSDATLAIVKDAVQIAETIAPASSPLTDFFAAAIQDAASRGYTVQAVVDAPALPAPVETAEALEKNYPKVMDKPRGKAANKDVAMVKVGYKFEEETVNFLNDLAKQLSGLNKSGWIEELIRATPEYQEWKRKKEETN